MERSQCDRPELITLSNSLHSCPDMLGVSFDCCADTWTVHRESNTAFSLLLEEALVRLGLFLLRHTLSMWLSRLQCPHLWPYAAHCVLRTWAGALFGFPCPFLPQEEHHGSFLSLMVTCLAFWYALLALPPFPWMICWVPLSVFICKWVNLPKVSALCLFSGILIDFPLKFVLYWPQQIKSFFIYLVYY